MSITAQSTGPSCPVHEQALLSWWRKTAPKTRKCHARNKLRNTDVRTFVRRLPQSSPPRSMKNISYFSVARLPGTPGSVSRQECEEDPGSSTNLTPEYWLGRGRRSWWCVSSPDQHLREINGAARPREGASAQSKECGIRNCWSESINLRLLSLPCITRSNMLAVYVTHTLTYFKQGHGSLRSALKII